MSPFTYPLIGFIAGMFGGWFWQNIKPGIIAAFVIALLAGSISTASDRTEGLDYLSVGLSVVLAMLMSFTGSVAGTRIRDYFEGKYK